MNGRFTLSDVDHLGLRIGDSLCLRYVLHGEPVSDAAVLIGHHGEFAVLDEVPMTDLNMLQLERDLDRDEGRRRKPYRDSVGKLTIGVGRNLTDVGITNSEAMLMLDNDIIRSMSDLDQQFLWWRDLNDVRQMVMVDMAFNLGIGGLSKFVRTMKAVERGDWDAAANGMLESKWAKQVKGRAVKLAKMMRTGELT